jgi:hypothetical protein
LRPRLRRRSCRSAVVVGGDAYLPDRDDQGVCDLVADDGGVDDVEGEGVAGAVGGLAEGVVAVGAVGDLDGGADAVGGGDDAGAVAAGGGAVVLAGELDAGDVVGEPESSRPDA